MWIAWLKVAGVVPGMVKTISLGLGLPLWQRSQLAVTLKAFLPLWQAPQVFPFSISAMETDLPLPVMILPWQLRQAPPVLAMCTEWLKVASPNPLIL